MYITLATSKALAAFLVAAASLVESASVGVVVDSTGGPSVVRRERPRRHAKRVKAQPHAFSELELGQKVESSRRQDYILAGTDSICGGPDGGLYMHYEMTTEIPGTFESCSTACDSKEECIGFDIGGDGCNLYTTKAVAFGSWMNVMFHESGAWPGKGDYVEEFAQHPTDLTPEERANSKCYRRTTFKPAQMWYWPIGDHTCAGGGLWKRYKMTPASQWQCENACNQRDECIGYDVGIWVVTQIDTQLYQKDIETNWATESGCHLYTQKPVYGNWPGVQIKEALPGEYEHDAFPPTPLDLKPEYVFKYEAANDTKCYGKTDWVDLSEYYWTLGEGSLCEGDGVWRHYKRLNAEDRTACEDMCDQQDLCLGFDFDSTAKVCRAFTQLAIPKDMWGTNIEFNGTGYFVGSGDHEAFAPTPYSLKPVTQGDADNVCCAKVHWNPQDALLGNNGISYLPGNNTNRTGKGGR